MLAPRASSSQRPGSAIQRSTVPTTTAATDVTTSQLGATRPPGSAGSGGALGRRAPRPAGWGRPSTTTGARIQVHERWECTHAHSGGPGPSPRSHLSHQHDRADARHLLPGPRKPAGERAPARFVAFLAGHGGPCRHRVRLPVPERSGRGGGRHQGLPVPRSGPPAEQRQHHVGPGRGRWHGPPPEHRLPVPDGAVLLARRADRAARLGRPAAVDRPGVDGGRGRRPLAAPDARPEWHRPRERCAAWSPPRPTSSAPTCCPTCPGTPCSSGRGPRCPGCAP